MLDQLDQLKVPDPLPETMRHIDDVESLAHVGSWNWNISTNRVQWSNELYRIYGLKPQELHITFERYMERVHPEDRKVIAEKIQAALSSQSEFQYRERIVRPDGTVRMLQSRGRVIRSATGQPLEMLGACHDITEQHEAEEQLRNAHERQVLQTQGALAASEARLQLAADATRLGIFEIDLGTGHSVRNLHHDHAFGYEAPPEVWSMKDFLEHIHPDDGDRVMAELMTAIQEKRKFDLQFRVIWPDQTQHWMTVSGTVESDAGGKPVRIRGINRDITERREAEEHLERAHAKALISHRITAALSGCQTPEEVASVLLRELLTHFGGEAGLVLRHPPGSPTFELLAAEGYPEERVRVWRNCPVEKPFALSECVRTGEPVFLENLREVKKRFPLMGKTAARIGTRAFANLPLRLNDHIVGGVSVVFCRERQFPEEERVFMLSIAAQGAQALERVLLSVSEKRAVAELEKAVRMRDEFLSLASHELKTPITSLVLQNQLARRRLALDPTGACDIDRVHGLIAQTEKSLFRLTRLIDDMLDISRISTGKLSFMHESVDLGNLAADVAERLEMQADAAGTRISVLAEPGVIGQWDRFRVEQLITNLLTNAIRYGQATPIEVEVGSDGTWAFLSVRDSGPGVAEADHQRIFERFERAATHPAVGGGLGLGLYLCREVAERHQGTIHVESRLGEGARFVVRLPQ